MIALFAMCLSHAFDGKIIRFGGAAGKDDFSRRRCPISRATWSRAESTAASASQPKAWFLLAALPNRSKK